MCLRVQMRSLYVCVLYFCKIAEEHKTTIDAVIYAWLFVHPVRIAAITGTMNADRIQTAVDATNWNFLMMNGIRFWKHPEDMLYRDENS